MAFSYPHNIVLRGLWAMQMNNQLLIAYDEFSGKRHRVFPIWGSIQCHEFTRFFCFFVQILWFQPVKRNITPQTQPDSYYPSMDLSWSLKSDFHCKRNIKPTGEIQPNSLLETYQNYNNESNWIVLYRLRLFIIFIFYIQNYIPLG